MANLCVDHSLGAANVSVPCLVCGAMHRLVDSTIDRDGPAFRAYYCRKHVPDGVVDPCTHDGCTRAHQSVRAICPNCQQWRHPGWFEGGVPFYDCMNNCGSRGFAPALLPLTGAA